MRKLLLALAFCFAYLASALAQPVVPVQMRDANLTTTANQNFISTLNTFTAPRSLVLPGRGALSAYYVQFVDTAGAVNGANTLTITMADGGLINGGASLVVSQPNIYLFIVPSSSGYRATGIFNASAPTTIGGTNGQVQYNNAGVFGGISGATSNGTTLTLVAPILGTPASATLTNATGLPISTGLTGAGTGVLTALGVNVGSAGAFVVNGGALGTPSSGTLTNTTGFPVANLSGVGAGCLTWLATPSSANLRGCLTDESGTGAAYFQGGDLGTPSAGVGSNLTSLNASNISSGNLSVNRLNGGSGASASTFWRGDGAWGAAVTSVSCGGVTITGTGTCPPTYEFVNCSLAASAAGSALTIALKDNAGSDPSATSPCVVNFRNVTAATGSWTQLSVTAANSLVVSSGSTLGVTSSTAFRLWVVGFNDAGTFRLGVINTSSPTAIVSVNSSLPGSSTAEGGAGGADNAGTIYTGTAVTSKSLVLLGYLEWSSSGLTAGTWTTTNLLAIVSMGPGIKKPGDILQTIIIPGNGSSARACSTTYADVGGTTITMTPYSAANAIQVRYTGLGTATAGGAGVNTEIFATIAVGGTAATGSSINTIGVTSGAGTNQQTDGSIAVDLWHNPNSTSAQAYTLQSKGLNASGNCNVASVWGRAYEVMR